MTLYKNFTVDLPSRIRELDPRYKRIAKSSGLEVSYLLMKLSTTFLLPYERAIGSSGARDTDLLDQQKLRKDLELDKKFASSAKSVGEFRLG